MQNALLNYSQVRAHIRRHQLRPDYLNIAFISFCIFTSVFGLISYYGIKGYEWHLGPWITSFVLYWLIGLGITMGYHRYFSHKTFKAHPFLEFLMLLFGAMALQNSALKWSHDHRLHHAYTDDDDRDPYNASFGLLWTHLLWIFFSAPKVPYDKKVTYVQNLKKEFPNAIDLINNPLVVWQHRYSHAIGIIGSFLIPGLIGMLMGGENLGEYLLVAGMLRIFVVYQSTFFINSLAHALGTRPHSTEVSARDSFFCSLLAFGEGYHNYHHTYPNDYRNGIKYYHFDPTKWVIYCCSLLGLTKNLKRRALN